MDVSELPPDNHTSARRPRLSRERIITATLALIDEQGIAAASMRSVAQRLAVQPMALYRHVDNREQLFDEVVEHIVDELTDDPDVLQTADHRGWRPYLESLAWGVRRYARAHPHAFPLVATRPPDAPWINPPLRSLRWVEAMLSTLSNNGFNDNQVLFAYRSFNSFLLGYLLLETSAMAIADPLPGDGSFQAGDGSGDHDPVDPTDPVPAALSATRTTEQRHTAADVMSTASSRVAKLDQDSAKRSDDALVSDRFPIIERLLPGLTEDRYAEEFAAGLDALLTRIGESLNRGDGT